MEFFTQHIFHRMNLCLAEKEICSWHFRQPYCLALELFALLFTQKENKLNHLISFSLKYMSKITVQKGK